MIIWQGVTNYIRRTSLRRSGGGPRCPQQGQQYRPGHPRHQHHHHQRHNHHQHHYHQSHNHLHFYLHRQIVPNIVIDRKHLGAVPSYWECFSTFCQQVKSKNFYFHFYSYLTLFHFFLWFHFYFHFCSHADWLSLTFRPVHQNLDVVTSASLNLCFYFHLLFSCFASFPWQWGGQQWTLVDDVTHQSVSPFH